MLKKIFLFILLFCGIPSIIFADPILTINKPAEKQAMPPLVTVGFKKGSSLPLLVSQSVDGIQWNTFTYPLLTPNMGSLWPIIWGNHEYFMIYHQEASGNIPKWSGAMVSQGLEKDGSILWSAPIRFAEDVYIWDVTWGNNQYVAVGNKGEIFHATKATDKWERVKTSPATSLRRILWANQQYIAVGNEIITSPDGKNWTSHIKNLGNVTLAGVVWAANKYVIVGYDYTTKYSFSITSLDGKNWSPKYIINLPNFEAAKIAWGNGQFVIVGGSAIYSSPDGVTWAPRWKGDYLGLSDVIWANNQFVAVGYKTEIHSPTITSPDGIHWTPRDSKTDYDLYSVAYNRVQ